MAHHGIEEFFGFENVNIFAVAVEKRVGRVFIAHNGLDAGDGLGGGSIDIYNTGMGLGGEKNLAAKHAGKVHVVQIFHAAGDLHHRVLHGNALADNIHGINMHS